MKLPTRATRSGRYAAVPLTVRTSWDAMPPRAPQRAMTVEGPDVLHLAPIMEPTYWTSVSGLIGLVMMPMSEGRMISVDRSVVPPSVITSVLMALPMFVVSICILG